MGFWTGPADLGQQSRLYEIVDPDQIPDPEVPRCVEGKQTVNCVAGFFALRHQPEDVSSYERGLKNEFFARQLILNLAVFDTEVTDYQSMWWTPAPARCEADGRVPMEPSAWAHVLNLEICCRRASDGNPKQRGVIMLHWALTFLVIAIIAAIFGFGGIAATASSIAQILFVVFLALFLVSAIVGMTRGRPPAV